MAIDTYKNMMGGLESPAREALAVMPDEVNDLVNTSRSIYVGTAGDITVHMIRQTTPVVFKSVPVGVLPIRPDFGKWHDGNQHCGAVVNGCSFR